MAGMFGQKPKYTLSPRGDRLVRWIQNQGHVAGLEADSPTATLELRLQR